MPNTEVSLVGGLIGTSISAAGTATQTNETLQTISLIITIVGAVISMIIIPTLNWYLKAKADGKFTKEEIKEGIDTIKEGIDGVNDTINKKGEQEDNARCENKSK